MKNKHIGMFLVILGIIVVAMVLILKAREDSYIDVLIEEGQIQYKKHSCREQVQ